MTFKYHVFDHSVCQNAFLRILNITKHRVAGVFQRFKSNVSVYTWTEDEDQKSSNEVASVLYKKLTDRTVEAGSSINDVCIVADGCLGQNKNINILTMCCWWLYRSKTE